MLVSVVAILFKPWAAKRAGLSLLILAASLEARVDLTPCRNNYSPAAQIQLGDTTKATVYKQMPILPDSNPVSKYVEQLGTKLAQYAPGYKWPFRFHVVNTDDINAFALPGGSIFVNLGTVQAAQNEAQLAGVMAHEISHVVLQHSVCNQEKEQRVGLFAGLGQVAAGVMLGQSTAGQMAEQGIAETTRLGFLKMSRGDEKQADEEGTQILYDAGYDPQGMAQFFTVIEAKYGAGGVQFLSDHPNPGNRTEYVDREIATFPARENNVTTSPEFERIAELVSTMKPYTAGQIAAGQWKNDPGNTSGQPNPSDKQHAKNGQHRGGKGKRQNGGADAGSESQEEGVVDLSAPTRWKDVMLDGLGLEIPASWRIFRTDTHALAGPHGGVMRGVDGNAGTVTYGLITDVYKPEKDATAATALTALLHVLTDENPNVKVGEQRETKVGNVSLQLVECMNPHGRDNRRERFWVAALPISNGSMRYLAFVAPAADFPQMRPTFHHILRGVTVQF